MVVEYARPLVKAPRVPRVSEAELVEVEMVTELMAQGAQECPERRDFLANRCAHPDANQHGIRGIVAKQFECLMLTGA